MLSFILVKDETYFSKTVCVLSKLGRAEMICVTSSLYKTYVHDVWSVSLAKKNSIPHVIVVEIGKSFFLAIPFK